MERTEKIAAPLSESRNNTLFGRGALRVQTKNGSPSTGKGPDGSNRLNSFALSAMALRRIRMKLPSRFRLLFMHDVFAKPLRGLRGHARDRGFFGA
jgi:hypothetical protein